MKTEAWDRQMISYNVSTVKPKLDLRSSPHLWVWALGTVTERMRLWTQDSEMSFLHKVDGWPQTQTGEEIKYPEGAWKLGGWGIGLRCLLATSYLEVFWACPTRRRPSRSTQNSLEELFLARENLEIPKEELENVAREKDIWNTVLGLLSIRTWMSRR